MSPLSCTLNAQIAASTAGYDTSVRCEQGSGGVLRLIEHASYRQCIVKVYDA